MFQWHHPQVDFFPIYYDNKLPCLGSGCSKSVMGRPASLCLSPNLPSGSSSKEVDSARLTQHDMVLGCGHDVLTNPTICCLSPSVRISTGTSHLNLHAWLLESWPSRSKVSLTKRQYELRILRDVQLEQSMK